MKKIISILLACMMLVSMAAIVSADDDGTFFVSDATKSDSGYYVVKVSLKDIDTDYTKEINGIQLQVLFDVTKFKAGYIQVIEKPVHKENTILAGDKFQLPLYKNSDYSSIADLITLNASNPSDGVIQLVGSTGSGINLLNNWDDTFNDGKSQLVAEVYLTPIDGATGKTSVSVGNAIMSGNNSLEWKNFTYTGKEIDLGGATTEYTVTASANEYGSVDKEEQQTVGGAASITATGDVVNEGEFGEVTYVIDDIKVGGTSIGSTALAAYKGENEVTYPLTGVAADTSVEFIFKPATASVSYLRKLTPYIGDDQEFNNAVLIGGQFVPGSDAADFVDGIFGVEAYSTKESKTVYYPANDISDYGFFFVGLWDAPARQGVAPIRNDAEGLRVFAETKDGETMIFDKELN